MDTGDDQLLGKHKPQEEEEIWGDDLSTATVPELSSFTLSDEG